MTYCGILIPNASLDILKQEAMESFAFPDLIKMTKLIFGQMAHNFNMFEYSAMQSVQSSN